MHSVMAAVTMVTDQIKAGENTVFFICWCAAMLAGAIALVFAWEYVGRRIYERHEKTGRTLVPPV